MHEMAISETPDFKISRGRTPGPPYKACAFGARLQLWPPTAKSLKYALYPSAVVSNLLFGVGGVYGLHFCIPGTSLKIRGNFCKEYK